MDKDGDPSAQMTESEEVRERYIRFAEFEAKDYSPIYWSFTTAVARNEHILKLLAALPTVKQQPNLLLSAVRLLHGVAGWIGIIFDNGR